MTGLSSRKAAQFFRGEDFVSAQHVTLGSGIQGLVPGAGEGWFSVSQWSSAQHITLGSGIQGLVPGADEGRGGGGCVIVGQ